MATLYLYFGAPLPFFTKRSTIEHWIGTAWYARTRCMFHCSSLLYRNYLPNFFILPSWDTSNFGRTPPSLQPCPLREVEHPNELSPHRQINLRFGQ